MGKHSSYLDSAITNVTFFPRMRKLRLQEVKQLDKGLTANGWQVDSTLKSRSPDSTSYVGHDEDPHKEDNTVQANKANLHKTWSHFQKHTLLKLFR